MQLHNCTFESATGMNLVPLRGPPSCPSRTDASNVAPQGPSFPVKAGSGGRSRNPGPYNLCGSRPLRFSWAFPSRLAPAPSAGQQRCHPTFSRRLSRLPRYRRALLSRGLRETWAPPSEGSTQHGDGGDASHPAGAQVALALLPCFPASLQSFSPWSLCPPAGRRPSCPEEVHCTIRRDALPCCRSLQHGTGSFMLAPAGFGPLVRGSGTGRWRDCGCKTVPARQHPRTTTSAALFLPPTCPATTVFHLWCQEEQKPGIEPPPPPERHVQNFEWSCDIPHGVSSSKDNIRPRPDRTPLVHEGC